MLRFTDHLIMQLTKDCNLKCSYCFQGDKSKWKNKQVDFDDFKKIIDTAIYYRCVLGKIENHIDFHFHGGEVTLLDTSLLEMMVDYIYKRKAYFPNLSCCFQTNGTLLTEELCRFLKEKNIVIGVSLDGLTSPGRFSDTFSKNLITKLKKLSEQTGCKFSFLSVLTVDNIKDWFSSMVEFQKLFKYDSLYTGVNVVSVTKEGKQITPSIDDQWNYWLKPVLESYLTPNPIRERGIQIVIEKALQDIIFESNRYMYSGGKTGCFDRICGHGSNMISIDPDLNLYSCDKFLEDGEYISLKKPQSIFQRDFLGLQQANRCVKYYKDMFVQENSRGCDNCEAKRICSGECQAVNISNIGSCSLSEDTCKMFKMVYDWIYNHWVDLVCLHSWQSMGQVTDISPSALKILNMFNIKIGYDIHSNMYRGYVI